MNFRDDDDELIGADLCGPTDEVLLISTKGQAIRFPANDEELRPMGRATSGVTGMKFRPGDELLSMSIIRTAASPRTTATSSPSPTAASPSGRRSRSTGSRVAAASASRP